VRGIPGDYVNEKLSRGGYYISYADLYAENPNQSAIIEFKLCLKSGESLYSHNPIIQAKNLADLLINQLDLCNKIDDVMIVIMNDDTLFRTVLNFLRTQLRLKRVPRPVSAALNYPGIANIQRIFIDETPLRLPGFPNNRPFLNIVLL